MRSFLKTTLFFVLLISSCQNQDDLNQKFYEASVKEDLKTMQSLLQKGADVNFQSPTHNNETALHAAVDKEYRDIVLWLLKKEANANLKNKNGEKPIDYLKGQYREEDPLYHILAPYSKE